MALARHFGSLTASGALERRFGRPDGAQLALERRFGRPDGVKLVLERRFGRPDGVKLALERRFGRPGGAVTVQATWRACTALGALVGIDGDVGIHVVRCFGHRIRRFG